MEHGNKTIFRWSSQWYHRTVRISIFLYNTKIDFERKQFINVSVWQHSKYYSRKSFIVGHRNNCHVSSIRFVQFDHFLFQLVIRNLFDRFRYELVLAQFYINDKYAIDWHVFICFVWTYRAMNPSTQTEFITWPVDQIKRWFILKYLHNYDWYDQFS